MKRIIYNFNSEEDVDCFKRLCTSMDVKSKPVRKSDIDLPVGTLFGITLKKGVGMGSVTKAPADYSLPEMMIFFGFDDKELEDFLEEYKNSKLSLSALKAVVTMYNMHWNVYMLAVELQKERDGVSHK